MLLLLVVTVLRATVGAVEVAVGATKVGERVILFDGHLAVEGVVHVSLIFVEVVQVVLAVALKTLALWRFLVWLEC